MSLESIERGGIFLSNFLLIIIIPYRRICFLIRLNKYMAWNTGKNKTIVNELVELRTMMRPSALRQAQGDGYFRTKGESISNISNPVACGAGSPLEDHP